MILITSIYDSGHEARNRELMKCVERNEECAALSEIYRFMEFSGSRTWADDVPWLSHKSIFLPAKRRQTFADMFKFSNAVLPDGSLVCIANADIWFDATLLNIEDRHVDWHFLCLSRWDTQADGKYVFDVDAPISQDAWIFKTPAPDSMLAANFLTGCMRCDNVLARIAAGTYGQHKVYNPTHPAPRSIVAHHEHVSQVHNYGPIVDGPMILVYPVDLP